MDDSDCGHDEWLFREDYRPGAGSATVPDGNTDSYIEYWILLSIVESKNRKALLLTGGTDGAEWGGEDKLGFGTQEVFHNVLLKKEEQDS